MIKNSFRWLLIVGTIAALLLSGRMYRLHVRRQWLKPVAIDTAGGLATITLPVISRSCNAHGGCVVETDGLYQGKPTGATFIFAPDMRPSTFTGRVETTQVFPVNAGIKIVSEGPRGRSLLALLAAIYGTKPHENSLAGDDRHDSHPS